MNKWDRTINKDLTEEFILYLFEGFEKFGHDKYADHVLYYGVRKITEAIGLAKTPRISKKARANTSGTNIREHKVPAITFYNEFREKKAKGEKFTHADIARWFDLAEIAIISKEEDDELTRRGWRDKERPYDAYDQIHIELEDQV